MKCPRQPQPSLSRSQQGSKSSKQNRGEASQLTQNSILISLKEVRIFHFPFTSFAPNLKTHSCGGISILFFSFFSTSLFINLLINEPWKKKVSVADRKCLYGSLLSHSILEVMISPRQRKKKKKKGPTGMEWNGPLALHEVLGHEEGKKFQRFFICL